MSWPGRNPVGNDLGRIVPLQTEGTKPPLYCVHAVSGSAYAYVGLARLLGPGQPVYGFEAPGFDNDQTPVRSLPALAAEYTAILREFQPEGGYQLLGWSLGGVLVFEMAKRLVAADAKVSSVILVDAGLPVVQDLPSERAILRRYIQDMMGMSDESPAALAAIFNDWPEDVQPTLVFEAVELAGILPRDIDADLLANQYTVFRAHLEAFYSVEVGGTYAGATTHILAAKSPMGDMRWGGLAPDLKEFIIPGTHHSIWTGDGVAAISEIVRQSLSHAGGISVSY
jgi:thioesterase domain-containing protein